MVSLPWAAPKSIAGDLPTAGITIFSLFEPHMKESVHRALWIFVVVYITVTANYLL